jgi:hypothetical protein
MTARTRLLSALVAHSVSKRAERDPFYRGRQGGGSVPARRTVWSRQRRVCSLSDASPGTAWRCVRGELASRRARRSGLSIQLDVDCPHLGT